MPEAVLWLLLTGEYPTDKEMSTFVKEIHQRGHLKPEVENMILSLPKTMHPMTQFSIGVLACQPESIFAKSYREGLRKTKYWEYVFEDSMDVIAKNKRIAALIYHNLYKAGTTPKSDASLDFGADMARMMGFKNQDVEDLLRLYICVHMDHEGGNVSAHTNRLVGSALSDPYLCFSASLNGLAGPLHGLAN
jgi:citrate synthase